jgi:D-beta-D-heptose 7-phosphate kinase/D-beta-D-heptose 1-phosphate adenosyltransferase
MQNKILDPETLQEKLQASHRKGHRIVFTNGCFDILHVGHLRYLTAARQEGDLLVVGLNSDRSVAEIKGPRRPIVPEQQRAEILSGLSCIDYVTLFDEPDPFNLIQLIRPDVLVKGDDWPEDQIIGADIVKADGGKVVRVPLVKGNSTTAIIDKILKNYT